MPRPVVSEAAEEFHISLGPWGRADEAMGEAGGWPLLIFSEGVAGRLQPLLDVISDTADGPGWSPVLDVDRASLAWLPWLGQLVGVDIDTTLPEADQRNLIRALPRTVRGTPQSIVAAAQRFLTGTGTVYLVERHGSAWRMTVSMLDTEAPVDKRRQIELAVLGQKPAGIVAAIDYITGGDYTSFHATHATYTAVHATYATYDDILADPTL